MKLKSKHIIILTAALAAAAAAPLSANAADEDWYEEGTNHCCEGTDWYFDGGTDHCEEWWDAEHSCWRYYGDTDEYDTETVPVRADKLGDIDCDGVIQIADGILFARDLAEDPLVFVSSQGRRNENVNGDDTVDGKDLQCLLMYLSSSSYQLGGPQNEGAVTTCTTDDTWQDDTETTSFEVVDRYAPYLCIINPENIKTVYQVGEPLDVSNLIVGTWTWVDPACWDYYHTDGQERFYLSECPDFYDASEFDSTQPGTYTIYVRDKTGRFSDGTEWSDMWTSVFTVTVIPEVYEGTQLTAEILTTTTTTTTRGAASAGTLWIMDDGEWKKEYRIGEELDIMNARLWGCGETADGGNWDIFGEYTLAEQISFDHLEVDTSEFDNTKPGTYTIYLRQINDAPAVGSFEVTVTAD